MIVTHDEVERALAALIEAQRSRDQRRFQAAAVASFLRDRDHGGWSEVMTTSKGAARDATREYLEDAARRALRLRDEIGPRDAQLRARAEAEAHRLIALARSA